MLNFKPGFHSALSLSSQGSLVLFASCHNSDVICLSEAIDTFPGNLDSRLCFIQPGISHNTVKYKLNEHSENIQP